MEPMPGHTASVTLSHIYPIHQMQCHSKGRYLVVSALANPELALWIQCG
jgi:hypothetical protein